MRVGEILLDHGWVDRDGLERALAEQPGTGLRLCSLLLARGMVGFDHAARALGQQLGVPAALHRHLEHRDPRLARLLPATIGRGACALPLGRMANGALVVCARDPSITLLAELADAIGAPIVLAVAPQRPLEHLVALAYVPRPTEDFVLDIELDAGTDDSVDVDLAVEVAPEVPFDLDITVEPLPPPPPRTTPRPRTVLPVEIRVVPPAASPPRATLPARHSLEGTIASLADVDAIDWLFDVVMAYVATRWTTALLFEIVDQAARGCRGHGPQLTDAVARAMTVPLTAPSILQLACDQRRLVDQVPPGAGEAQAQLAARLGEPRGPIAAVLTRGDVTSYALVVGDPQGDDPEDAAVDLARLAEALDEALERIS